MSAPLAIAEAMALMGIKAKESWALPEKVEALVEALDLPGFGKSRAASTTAASPAAAAATPAPAASAAMPSRCAQENNELTASDRRILIGRWYVKAFKKACEGEAKRKYFEHTGGLLTADGSGDALLKLEGKPIGEVFGWDDTPVDVEEAELGAGEVEPPDIAPQRALGQREGEDPTAQNFVDDEDESDVDETCRPRHARLRRASRSRTNRRVQSSSPSARRRRR